MKKGVIFVIVILLIIFVSLIYFFNPGELFVKEDIINKCQENSDCIIVPYDHCCGLTKRAINKKYLDDYNHHLGWQKVTDCSMLGKCAINPDVNLTISAICEKERCRLDSNLSK